MTDEQEIHYKTWIKKEYKEEKSIFALNQFCSNFAPQKYDLVAQLVEHIPFKDGVLGSSPS